MAEMSVWAATEEVECICRNPYRTHPECLVCMHFDEMTCSRGDDCAGTHQIGRTADGEPVWGPATIGGYLDEHPDTGHPIGRSATMMRVLVENPLGVAVGALVCEDCAYEIGDSVVKAPAAPTSSPALERAARWGVG